MITDKDEVYEEVQTTPPVVTAQPSVVEEDSDDDAPDIGGE